jgi:hypothetical protein
MAWTISPSDSSLDCSPDWSVAFAFPAADFADELLVCVTEPSSPGLWIRTGALTLLARTCFDDADESAD